MLAYLGFAPLPSQSTVGVCNEITLLFLYYISSRLGTLLNTLRTGDADLRFHITTVQDG
jgi:hypothetical protein